MCRGGGDECGLREGGGVAALGHGAVGGGHGGRVLAEPVGGGPDERVDHVAGRGGVAGHGARKTDVGVARLGGHRGFAAELVGGVGVGAGFVVVIAAGGGTGHGQAPREAEQEAAGAEVVLHRGGPFGRSAI